MLGGDRAALWQNPCITRATSPEPASLGRRSHLILELDVVNIPCAWALIIHDSLGSAVAGLGHFLLTSGIGSCNVTVERFIICL